MNEQATYYIIWLHQLIHRFYILSKVIKIILHVKAPHSESNVPNDELSHAK